MDAAGLKILLLEAGQRMPEEWPPLGLGYISSFLKKHFENINIKIAMENQQKYINEFKPDIVGISSVSQDYGHAKHLARSCRRKGIPVIIGGSHISSLPKTLTPDMNVGVLGQGEEISIELINIFLKNRCFNPEQLALIKGVIYRGAPGNIVCTEWPSLPVDMDYIPFPERVSIPKNKMIHLITSRGCRYRCSYCTPSILTKSIRFFSAGYVIDEINYYMSKYNTNDFFIFDDQFISNIERIEEMVQIADKNNLSSRVNLAVNCRADLINKDILVLLKAFGVKSIGLGLESMSERILRYLKGPSIKVGDNIKAVALLKKTGFKIMANMIIGSPNETKEEMLNSINFLLKNKIYNSSVYILTPFPGTAVWEYAKSKALVSEDEGMDWERIGFSKSKDYIYEHNFGKKIILSETLTRKQLYRLYNYFINRRKIIFFEERIRNFLKKQIRWIKINKQKDSVKLFLNKNGLLLATYRLLNNLGLTNKGALIRLFDSGIAAPPEVLEYEITDRCNLHCRMCIFKYKKPCPTELTSDEIRRFIKRLPKSIRHAFITGGEPFLRKDIVNVLSYFDEAGIYYTVLTNGTILNEDIADSLSRLKNLSSISISLDSLGPLHDSIRAKGETFKDVLNTVEKLKKRQININIVTVLLRDNLNEVEEIAAYAKKNKIDYFIQPENLYAPENALKTHNILDSQNVTPHMILEQKGENSLGDVPVHELKQLARRLKRLDIGSPTGSRVFRDMPAEYTRDTIQKNKAELNCCDWGTLHINSCGDIIGCMAIRKPFGNVLIDDILTLWNSSEYVKFRLALIRNNLLPICNQCCKMDLLR